MLRKLLSIAIATVLSFTVVVSPAYAVPFPFSLPWFQDIDLTEEQQELIQQLEDKYVPEIESILFPEQQAEFEKAIQNGYSMRKAFRDMALTPQQKYELASVVKTIPKSAIFASLTPEQKKEIFLKKKEMFMPTPEEITEKIKAGMEAKDKFAPDVPRPDFAPTAEEIGEKIKAGFEKKKAFMPSVEDIQEKISEQIEDALDD
jgi:DNA-binding MarR family transcriptional regulator